MSIESISPDDLKRILSEEREADYLLVDVRQPEEYQQEHIPGAKLVPLSELEGRLHELDQSRQLIFYCRSGRRSNTGAAFARDSGLVDASIANLVGGISAWDGKVLEEFPRFEALRGAGDPVQLLTRAMDMEKGTHALYQAMAETPFGQPIQTTLEKLARMETAHARVIHHHLAKMERVKDFETLYADLDGAIVEGGWDLDSALQRIRKQGENPCLFLAELALELEYRAYDLYRAMAEQTDDAERQRSFFFLSEQEKAHIRVLARGLPGCFA